MHTGYCQNSNLCPHSGRTFSYNQYLPSARPLTSPASLYLQDPDNRRKLASLDQRIPITMEPQQFPNAPPLPVCDPRYYNPIIQQQPTSSSFQPQFNNNPAALNYPYPPHPHTQGPAYPAPIPLSPYHNHPYNPPAAPAAGVAANPVNQLTSVLANGLNYLSNQLDLNSGPGSANAVPPPPPPRNTQRGLESLLSRDKVMLRQKVEMVEVFTSFESRNRYQVLDPDTKEELYFAEEESDAWHRCFYCSRRAFEMTLKDGMGEGAISLSRPLSCGWCCCPCWPQSMTIFDPEGRPIGSVQQKWNFMVPKFAIRNADGETIFYIKGKWIAIFGNDVKYTLFAKDGQTEVGNITKKWSGLVRELFTNADNFGLDFPKDLDPNSKAILLGACLLIDYMHYESSNNNARQVSQGSVEPSWIQCYCC